MAEKRKVSLGTPVSEIWLHVTTAHVDMNSFVTGVYYFVPNYQGKGGRIKCARGKLSNYQIILKVFPPKFAIWPHATIRHKSVDITRHQKSDCFAPTAQRNRTMIISKNSLKMSFLLYCQEWMNKPFLMKNSLTLGSSRNISYSSARCLVGILMNSWHPIISSKQLHLSSQ